MKKSQEGGTTLSAVPLDGGTEAEFEEVMSESQSSQEEATTEEVLEDAPISLEEELKNLSINLAKEMMDYAKLVGLSVNMNLFMQLQGMFSANLFQTMFFNVFRAQGMTSIQEILTEEDVDKLVEEVKTSMNDSAKVQMAQVMNNANTNPKSKN